MSTARLILLGKYSERGLIHPTSPANIRLSVEASAEAVEKWKQMPELKRPDNLQIVNITTEGHKVFKNGLKVEEKI